LHRRLRIEGQQRYYSLRTKEYRSAHGQVVVVRNSLLLAAAVAGVVSQTTNGSARAAWAVVAAVLGSLAGAVTAFDSLIGFPQLEKLYSDAERNLEEAAIDWDESGADIADEIERVEWIFRSERGQWGQLVVKSATSTQPAGQEDDVDRDEPAPPEPSHMEP
jgi:hypothetical protein